MLYIFTSIHIVRFLLALQEAKQRFLKLLQTTRSIFKRPATTMAALSVLSMLWAGAKFWSYPT